jgi:VanZ family protein
MKLVKFWLPVFLWMTIIFLLSSRQRLQVADDFVVNFLFFKTLHILEYMVLYVLTFRAFKYGSGDGLSMRAFLYAFAVAVIYAISDEIHQTLVPTREGTLRDVIIDAIGATLAWIAINQLFPKAPNKLKSWVRRWQLL